MITFATLKESEEGVNKLKEIYIKYKKLMYYIAIDILKDAHESEDAVQNSIIKLVNYIDRIDDINSNKTKHLIVTIVKNASIDIYRKKKKTFPSDIDKFSNLIESEDIPLDDLVIKLGEAQKLSKKIAELKNEYADILTLRYYHEFNNKEIANILNITNGNVRIKLYRARKALKKLMIDEK